MSSRVLESLPEVALRPSYDISRSYNDNAERGPQLSGPMPERRWPPRSQWGDFLGFKVASPLGVPAGPLLNAKWVCFASQLGFDILTYNTIRCRSVPCQPAPNMIFVDVKGDVAVLTAKPTSIEDLTVGCSFGYNSKDREFLQMDIESARESLRDGQLLIVSVYGSGQSLYDLAADYVRAASIAREAGAQVIEADFTSVSLEAAPAVAKAIIQAIGVCPLLIKTGNFESQESQREFMVSLAQAGVRGFSGINSLSMKASRPDGFPVLPGRPVVDVRGSGIRQEALKFVRQARSIIESEKLETVLIGCGGIVSKTHFNEFLQAGANLAMSATGMLWDPYIAMRWHS
ncbi:MAG: hypothetical protein Q8K75_03010 [Chlamydiales bacterium]|nr:hypothetical protein [Chlamydiales bacterium]